ncbi:MAG: DUF3333 domain-containing protein, partial [Proteobacteria bacterium]|nr:DUF3333 domain-containing protein [Pseudomonadota bacterium]
MSDSFEQIQAARRARMQAGLARRYAADRRFRLLGLSAIVFSALVLAFLLVSMTSNGIAGFQRAELRLTVPLKGTVLIDPSRLAQADPLGGLESAGLPMAVDGAADQAFGAGGAGLLGNSAWRDLGQAIIDKPAMLDQPEATVSLPASDDLASAMRGGGEPALQATAKRLMAEGKLVRAFDWGFLVRSDATSPQAVGIWGALKGSMMTMLVTLLLAFPVGVLSALYLEEYAPRNRWTDLIEISINNLAAVPSIIFGLLGLAVFLGLFPNWRSAPLIGGMTLALMTMPVIVISGRNAIKAVPPSI